MALRKGNAVASNPGAARDSMNGVDMSTPDDTPTAPQPEAAQAAAQGAATVEERLASPPPRPDTNTAPPPPVQEESKEVAPAIQPAPARPPAVQSEGGAMVASPAGTLSGDIKEELEAAGFGGLNLGFGAFPTVTLQNDGLFTTSEGRDLGKGFYCTILGSQGKFIYKNGVQGKEEDFVYSYDEIHTTDGTQLIEDVLAAWKAKGWTAEKRPYTDVRVQFIAETEDDPDDDMYMMLSIPRTSIPKYSGYVAILMGSGKHPSSVTTHVTVGDKVTRVAYPFSPWGFREYKG